MRRHAGPARGGAGVDRPGVVEDHVESSLRGVATNGMADEEWARLKAALDTFIR